MLMEAWRSAWKRIDWLVTNQLENMSDEVLEANIEYCP